MANENEKVTEASRQLADEGKLVSVGWVCYKAVELPSTTSTSELAALRKAFFAGAHHLYTGVMTIVDDKSEVTEDDLQRMKLLSNELDEFYSKELKPRN